MNQDQIALRTTLTRLNSEMEDARKGLFFYDNLEQERIKVPEPSKSLIESQPDRYSPYTLTDWLFDHRYEAEFVLDSDMRLKGAYYTVIQRDITAVVDTLKGVLRGYSIDCAESQPLSYELLEAINEYAGKDLDSSICTKLQQQLEAPGEGTF